MPARPLRILCLSYAAGPDGSGLWLNAYGGTGFSFRGHRPSALAQLLRKSATALGALRVLGVGDVFDAYRHPKMR